MLEARSFVKRFFGHAVVNEVSFVVHPLLEYPRLPFGSSYVPATTITTHSAVYGIIVLTSVYTVAWLERLALSASRGTMVLFVSTGAIWAVTRGMDAWQRRNRTDVELDELVDPPTLRLGLMD